MLQEKVPAPKVGAHTRTLDFLIMYLVRRASLEALFSFIKTIEPDHTNSIPRIIQAPSSHNVHELAKPTFLTFFPPFSLVVSEFQGTTDEPRSVRQQAFAHCPTFCV